MQLSSLKCLLAASLLALGSGSSLITAASTEAELIVVIQSGASREDKANACRELARVGSSRAIPALTVLLSEPELSHMSRYALEPIPDPAVDRVLREALGQLKGRLLVGVIGSLGVRRDAEAVRPLTPFLKDSDPDVAQAAARALGSIGTPTAFTALMSTAGSTSAENRLAFCEGLLRCAEALGAKGHERQAILACEFLRTMDSVPHQVRAGALRGAILWRGDAGLSLMTEALQREDWILVAAAARTALEMRGRDVTRALMSVVADLPESNQILVIETLGLRGDPLALDILKPLAQQGNVPVRIVAIEAMAQIADPRAAKVLADLLADSDRAVAQAAKVSLGSLPGSDVDGLVVALIESRDSRKQSLGIELAGHRRLTSAIPVLLVAATGPDARVRSAALAMVGSLGGRDELPALFALLEQASNNSELRNSEQALGAICGRIDDPAACTQLIAARLESAAPAQRAALVRVLGVVGGEQALAIVLDMLRDAEPEVHVTAIRTLSTWPTPDAAPHLLALVGSAEDATDRTLALRGYLRATGNSSLSVQQQIAMCRQAAAIIKGADETKLLLGTLGNIKAPPALNLIVPYLEDEAVRAEASAACLAVAADLLKRRNADRFAKALVEPLEAVIEASPDAATAKRARDLLGQAKAKSR